MLTQHKSRIKSLTWFIELQYKSKSFLKFCYVLAIKVWFHYIWIKCDQIVFIIKFTLTVKPWSCYNVYENVCILILFETVHLHSSFKFLSKLKVFQPFLLCVFCAKLSNMFLYWTKSCREFCLPKKFESFLSDLRD